MAASRPIGRYLGMGATAIAAAGCAVLSIGVSAGQIWSRSLPDQALRFWPHASAAKAEQAARLLTDPNLNATRRHTAREAARQALAADPTNVVAVRTRGLVAALDGDPTAARRWMSYAEMLSRRDQPTQLWLIEDAVARGDVDAALIHHDRALRTSKSAPELLFPVLVAATAEPRVADKLSRLVGTRPNWWGPFMNRLIGEAAHPVVLDLFARRLRLSPDDGSHPDFLPRILQRLVDAGEFARADALYRTSARDDGGLLLHDGSFEQGEGVLPFAWHLADDADLSARVERRPDAAAGMALLIEARNDRSGEVAAQAVALSPGSYVLRGVSARGGASDSAPVIRVRCGSRQGSALAAAKLSNPAPGARPFSVGFTVPSGCPGVWVVIEANSGSEDAADQPWIDDLSITRRSPASVGTSA